MGKLLRKCIECGRYTMNEEKCPQCGGKVVNPQPPRFSLVDKYGKYRRKLKKQLEQAGGN
ncbi:MAG: RNA-protein complex protein Nop10 [Candidatus Helarchaeota archaeon]